MTSGGQGNSRLRMKLAHVIRNNRFSKRTAYFYKGSWWNQSQYRKWKHTHLSQSTDVTTTKTTFRPLATYSELYKPWCYSSVVKILIQFHDVWFFSPHIKLIIFVVGTPALGPLHSQFLWWRHHLFCHPEWKFEAHFCFCLLPDSPFTKK